MMPSIRGLGERVIKILRDLSSYERGTCFDLLTSLEKGRSNHQPVNQTHPSSAVMTINPAIMKRFVKSP